MNKFMHAILNQAENVSGIPENWKKEESVFTGDHLIDAYLKGKKDGKNERVRILNRQFNENIKIATSASELLFAEAAERKIDFKAVHLKADGITSFSALFIADSKDFISEHFRDIFVLARGIKNKSESESFYISFSFMPDSKHLNENSILADGYFLKYEKK